MADAIKNGYAAATTDAGVGTYLDASWGLNSTGAVNNELLKNFADRSQHEMTVVAKQVIDEVYGKPASYSYWNGCSTGGRQGYMEAQRHPGDYDGILANAPAINWDKFEVATLWPQVVMNEENTFPAPCEFQAFNEAAVKACDLLDGAPDGLIGDPEKCNFDPRRLIGKTVECDGKQETITAADAAVVRKIWDGPRTPSGEKLWSGIPVGAGFDLAGTQVGADGNRKGAPFPVPAIWVSTFLKQQPSFDLSTITYAEFAKLFEQSQVEYDTIIGTDDPDLSVFRKSGGKLLTWQGQADQLIPAQGTVDYRERVERAMGGLHRVDDFYRLFLAPGVDHCAGDTSTGPKPTGALGALTAWVEHGKAPQTLSASIKDSSGKTVTRDLPLPVRLPLHRARRPGRCRKLPVRAGLALTDPRQFIRLERPALMNTNTPTPGTSSANNDRSSLQSLYLGRGILAVAWAAAFALAHDSLDAPAITLLVAYPLIDAVSSLIDLRALTDGSERRVTLFNGVLSTLAAIAVGLAGAGGVEAVLHVFGAWAVVSGAAQVWVGLRRRGPELGKQWPMLIAGGLSFVVGIFYNIQALGDNPSLDVLSVYATGGGVFFIIQAGLLAWRARKVRPQTV